MQCRQGLPELGFTMMMVQAHRAEGATTLCHGMCPSTEWRQPQLQPRCAQGRHPFLRAALLQETQMRGLHLTLYQQVLMS